MPVLGMNAAFIEAGKILQTYCNHICKINVTERVQRRTQNLLISMVMDEITIFYKVCKDASSLRTNSDQALKEMIDDIYRNFIYPMLNSHVMSNEILHIENPQKIMIMRYKRIFQWFQRRKRVAINLNHNTTMIVPRYVEQYL